jgi:plasmid stabilization system protein ParE
MAFEVLITDKAFADLDVITAFIKRQASINIARRWFAAIVNAIESLGEMPARCPVAEESADLEREVRLLLHGKRNRRYKVYFTIHEETKTVRVFHIRHWAMKPVESDELEDLMDETAEPGSEPEEST